MLRPAALCLGAQLLNRVARRLGPEGRPVQAVVDEVVQMEFSDATTPEPFERPTSRFASGASALQSAQGRRRLAIRSTRLAPESGRWRSPGPQVRSRDDWVPHDLARGASSFGPACLCVGSTRSGGSSARCRVSAKTGVLAALASADDLNDGSMSSARSSLAGARSSSRS